MSYGVQPTGYIRKSLPVILAELEAMMVTEFGPDVIQSPQSPLGQLNGLMADAITQLWEHGEEVYQSYDVDQSESRRLDTLAKLRLLRRGLGEDDASFRLAITNQGRARIDMQDIARAVRSVKGVTYSQVFLNDSNITDAITRLPPGTICVAVIGGDDEEIAAELRRYIVPGISTSGNVYVSTNIDGYCRTVAILRPILVPVTLTVNVQVRKDVLGCPPPSPIAIRDTLVASFAASLINGEDITHYRTRTVIESAFSNVEVLSISGYRSGEFEPLPGGAIPIDFLELATLAAADVTVNAT